METLREERAYRLVQSVLMIAVVLLFINWVNTQNKQIEQIKSELSAQREQIAKIELELKYLRTEIVQTQLENREMTWEELTGYTVSRGLPRESTGEFKSYMSYKAITDKTSAQWQLQQGAWTDENGFRRHGDRYMVAMGTYYADSVGKCFRVSFSSGQTIDVVVGDIKADKHTDLLNQYRTTDKSIIEFIVDVDRISEKSRTAGTMTEFSGDIIRIEEVIQ